MWMPDLSWLMPFFLLGLFVAALLVAGLVGGLGYVLYVGLAAIF